MLCLGIESSCDETALALVANGKLIDSVLASQVELHAIFGGVVPELASREHLRLIGPLFDRLLLRNKLSPKDIELISVARGPGLLGSLLVGVAFAKALALSLDKPMIGVNHLHAHLLAVALEHELDYPALGLLVSGGHTELYRIESPWSFISLGKTLDDAAGEAFDKIGKLLSLPYPAGKQIDELAMAGTPNNIHLPLPYLDNDNLDFSFSGLKTAAAQIAKEKGLLTPENRNQQNLCDFCAAFNWAIAETLSIKTARALEKEKDLKTLCVAGGVAANSLIRKKLTNLMKKNGGKILVPSPKFCTDNAIMIAITGEMLAQNGYRHDFGLESIPRGRKIPNDMQNTQFLK